MADEASRRENFAKTLSLLDEAIVDAAPSRLMLAAAIKAFEMAYEQAWKFLKLQLAEAGYVVASPREVFRKAFQSQWIDDEALWLAMIRDRNDTAHAYQELVAREIFDNIRAKYARALSAFLHRR